MSYRDVATQALPSSKLSLLLLGLLQEAHCCPWFYEWKLDFSYIQFNKECISSVVACIKVVHISCKLLPACIRY